VLLLMVAGLFAWDLAQRHRLLRMRADLADLQTALDSIQTVAARNAADIGRQDRRMSAIEERTRRSSLGVGHAEVVQLRRWIGRAERRAITNTDEIDEFGRRVERLERMARPAATIGKNS
jgi:hypothetical protein